MADLLLTCGTGMRVFYSIMLSLDSAIYWCVDVIYSVFIVICNTQLFSATTFEAFSSRIYAILGVVMLFIVTSQLLANIADPDKAGSGETSTGKLVKNIIISLIAIVLLPTAFKYLYVIQKAVVTENIIGNIIVGGYQVSTSKDFGSMVKHSGKDMAFRTFTAFINPVGYSGNNDKGCENIPGLTYCLAYDKINNYGSSDYGKVSVLSSPVYQGNITNEIYKGDVEYRWGFSSLAGILVAYFLLSYAIDMGVRVAKLAYYQLIAPVPIVLRIIPKQQSVFDNWVKGLLGTYAGVFIRLMIVYFCIFLINIIPAAWDGIVSAGGASDRSIVNTMVVILLIFGVFIFMKEAPKLITQMFGISDGDMSMGIGKKLAGAAVIGGAVTAAQKYGKKVQGGLTGGLGAGWNSMMNGEGFGAGFRVGSLGGYDAGGRQGKNQANELTRARYGNPKANAGMFGGVSLGTKYRAQTSDIRKSAFKRSSDARLEDARAAGGQAYKNMEALYRKKAVSEMMSDISKKGKDSKFTGMTEAQRNLWRDNQAKVYADDISLRAASGDSMKMAEVDRDLRSMGYDKSVTKGIMSELSAAGNAIKEEQAIGTEIEKAKAAKDMRGVIEDLMGGKTPKATEEPKAEPPKK